MTFFHITLPFALLIVIAWTFEDEKQSKIEDENNYWMYEDTNADSTPECPYSTRLRKPWSILSQTQRQLFVEGVQRLRKTGVLNTVTKAHSHNMVEHYIHGTSLFAFYHTYLIYEIETAIRNLGGEFACFAMPYWDWTTDAGSEDDPTILSSGLGADGGPLNNYCVQNDNTYSDNSDQFNWQLCSSEHQKHTTESCYWSPVEKYCSDTETFPSCCLKRISSKTVTISTAAQVGQAMYENSDFTDFMSQLSTYHGNVHQMISWENIAQMYDGYGTEDPIFLLLHNYVAYLRMMWSNCNGHLDIDNSDLQHHKEAYKKFCSGGRCKAFGLKLDSPMRYWQLKAKDWTLVSKEDITVRKTYDLSSNQHFDWDIQFELGSFWESSGNDLWCNDKLNEDFFVKTMDYSAFETATPVNLYVKSVREEMYAAGYEVEEILKATASLACKYVRENSGNSCWDASLEDLEIETCDGYSDNDIDDLTLEDMLNFDGIRDNDCLTQLRTETFSIVSEGWGNVDKKRALCDGDYDYKCPEWVDSRGSDPLDPVHALKLKSNNVNNYDFVMVYGPVFVIAFACLMVLYYVYQRCVGKTVSINDNVIVSSEYGSL